MTGEIDLNGNALPIGGLGDKLYGAKNAGVKQVLCPYGNKKDLDIILKEDSELSDLDIVMVKTIKDVIEHCFVNNSKNDKLLRSMR